MGLGAAHAQRVGCLIGASWDRVLPAFDADLVYFHISPLLRLLSRLVFLSLSPGFLCNLDPALLV